jgi:hypothetical protein
VQYVAGGGRTWLRMFQSMNSLKEIVPSEFVSSSSRHSASVSPAM